jgi:hypothetical protein
MADDGDKGFISEGSARELSRIVRWFRGSIRNTEGGGGFGDGLPENGPYVGKAQADIAPGTTGPVNLWVGTKGSEGDSGQTVQVYSRFATIASGDWVVFDLVDQGFEAVVPSLSDNSTAGCNCLDCVKNLIVNNAAQYWVINTRLYTAFGGCCDNSGNSLPNVLSGTDGTTWTTQPVQCGSNQCQWTLTIGETFVTLTFASGSKQIQYRSRVEEFAPLCQNQMTLWQPNNLPNPSACGPPCTICLAPIDQFYCDTCPIGSVPSGWTVTVPGAVSNVGGNTYNATMFSTTGDDDPPGCQWALTFPAANNTQAQVTVQLNATPGSDPDNNNCVIQFLLGSPGVAFGTFQGQPTLTFNALSAPCYGQTKLTSGTAAGWPGIADGNVPSSWYPTMLADSGSAA